VKASNSCFERIRTAMTLKWISARARAQFDSDPDSYEILSRTELDQILQGC
jgi:hypothetical protein